MAGVWAWRSPCTIKKADFLLFRKTAPPLQYPVTNGREPISGQLNPGNPKRRLFLFGLFTQKNSYFLLGFDWP